MSTHTPNKAKHKAPPSVKAWIAESVISLLGKSRAPANVDKLREVLLEMLPKDLSDHKPHIHRHNIVEAFHDAYWKSRADILRNATSARIPASKLYELLKKHSSKHPLPPMWVLEETLTEMHGRVSAPHPQLKSAMSGINRIPFADAKDRELKPTSFKHPYHALADVKEHQLKIAVIAGPQLGLPYDPDIYRNLTRCGLSAARKLNCDAIVIGGGLFSMEFQKTVGPSRLAKDMLSGQAIDFESFAEDYRDEAKQIIESNSLEPLFITAQERFTDNLRGWYKVSRRPGNLPEFKKPVYVILNPDDLGSVRSMTYFELLYRQFQRFQEANAVARAMAKEAATLLKLLNKGLAVNKEYEAARLEASKAAAKASRFRMSNLHGRQNKRVFKRALSFFITKLEEAIPGAVVIAQNSALMRFGANKHVLHLLSLDSSGHIKMLKTHGPTQRRGELPDLTLSMHPGAVYMRKGSRENYTEKGKMLGTVSFVEAPILVDKDPILSALEGQSVRSPVAKAVKDEMFAGGMLIVTLDNRFMPNADVLPTEVVRMQGQPNAVRTPAKRAWFALITDIHFAAANRLWLRTKHGSPIGICETAFEFLARSGVNRNGLAHVCGVTMADDLTQGNHFGTHMRPHHNQRTNASLVDEVEAALSRLDQGVSPKEREVVKNQLIRELTDQIGMFRPSHHWGSQLKELQFGLLDKYEHVFKAMLLRARETGVTVKGISQYTGFPVDARDVGLINFGSGNHATKTLDSAAFEGEIVADRLQVALRKDPDLRGMDLKKLICGPMHQDQSIGFGTMQLGEKGPVWGLHIAGTPPKRDSWYDLMHGWVQVNRQRGDCSTILSGLPILHMTGDKHFFGYAAAGGDHYVMGPSSTHTDAFADIAGGLPPNNAGVCFIGLPVEGLDRAEVSVVHLTPKVMQEYLTSGEVFPWDDFLPHRA